MGSFLPQILYAMRVESKLIVRPSHTDICVESLAFLLWIKRDICWPIHLSCGLMILHNYEFCFNVIDICRLVVYSNVIPFYQIQLIILDNAGELTSRAFNNDCLVICINVEHFLPNICMHNGLVEYLIQHLKLLTRSLIINVKIPFIVWGHAILHAAFFFIRVCP